MYTYEMFDIDGDEIAHSLGNRRKSGGTERIPVEVHGRTYALDPNDILLRAQGYFEAKYGREQGADFYLRWASVVTFLQENGEALQRARVVQVDEGQVVGFEPGFVRMLLDSYSPSPLEGGAPVSPLHEGEHGFHIGKCLDAWRSGKLF